MDDSISSEICMYATISIGPIEQFSNCPPARSRFTDAKIMSVSLGLNQEHLTTSQSHEHDPSPDWQL